MQYLQRYLGASLDSPASKGKVRLLFGARQTGKSTLLRHLMPANAIVVDLQNSETRLEYERRPKSFSEYLLAQPKAKKVVLVDEIQKIPALLDEIQWLYDQHRSRFNFYLTGSSARKLRSTSANLLPGRSHLYHLFPVLQAERAMVGTILPLPMKSSKPFPKRKLSDLLLYGSLPGLQFENPASAAKSLAGYAELYLEEEIRREGLVKDIGAFSRFLELAAMESGKTMNLMNISNQSGVPLTTIRLYYQVLVDSFVGYWLDPFLKGARKRLLTTPKFFFFDLGVRNAAARLGFSEDLLKLHGGELLEQWVGIELLHRVQYLGAGYSLGFWRTVGGAEVDFVLKTPKEVIPIEVKWTDRPSPSDTQHMRIFMEDVPQAKRGYVVCRVKEPRQLTDRIQAISWQDL